MAKNPFPKAVSINGTEFDFRLLVSTDRGAILNFAQRLDETDLSFMRRDITQPEMVDSWIHDVESQHATTILIETNNQIIGYGTLYYNQLFWNRHLGEIRILISSPFRNRGLGNRLTRELVKIAQEVGLEKVVMYMAVEDKSAQRMVEDLGFTAEALLTDWVKTRDDRTHDLLIMSASI